MVVSFRMIAALCSAALRRAAARCALEQQNRVVVKSHPSRTTSAGNFAAFCASVANTTWATSSASATLCSFRRDCE